MSNKQIREAELAEIETRLQRCPKIGYLETALSILQGGDEAVTLLTVDLPRLIAEVRADLTGEREADNLRRLAERIVVEIGSGRFTQSDAADVVFALLSANVREVLET